MRDRSKPRSRTITGAKPYVVAVCSYGFDEPINELLQAAGLAPEVTFVLTGHSPQHLNSHLANVEFSGWLDELEYHDLLEHAVAVIALTTREATMQNGLIEALEHRRPVVMSNTRTLHEWSEGVGGICLVSNDAPSIARGVRQVVSGIEDWERAASAGHEAASRRADAELENLTRAFPR